MRSRIIHLISELDIGGTETSLVKLLPHLQTEFENHVVSFQDGPVSQLLKQENIPVHITTPFKLNSLTKQLQPDLIITYLLKADLIGRFLAKLNHIPLISTQRSSLPGRSYLRLPEQLTSFLVDHYLIQTQQASKWLWRKNYTVIPNLVTPPSRIKASYTLSIPPRIICVSNLRPFKGHATLIKALPQNAQLDLAGSGHLKPELKTLSNQLSKQVDFLGTVQNVPEILPDYDLFILPSEDEGMSNALLEAMAAGLPIIASNISANQAVIKHQQTGILVTPQDPKQLNQAIQELLKNQTLRQNIGQAAHDYILNHHSPEKITQLWIQTIYANLK